MGGIFIAAGVASVGNGAYIVLRLQGRQTKVTVPGHVVTNTAYYLTGEIQRIDGATYPVEYTYNGLGNQATMTTFKDADTPQQTSWSYNSRGRMIAKTYADNSSVAYTYNGDGQLLTRTWARQANGTPLVTSYTYDAAGRQTGYSYSDGTTPAVTQTLNFLDQPVTVTDAAGTRNFTYNADHRLVNETIPSIVNGMIDYTYDAYGRRTVMSFGNGTTSFANAAYSYDSAGRIATVGNSADTLTYTYMPGTNIIGSSVWQNATLNTVNTYDSYKRLTNIAVNGVNVYGYTLNDKNQRTGATLPDGNTWSYDYDAMGQLTGAVKQSSGNTQLAGMSWLYDQIGNRTSATENNVTTSYISNLVNQYTQIASQFPTYDADGNMLTYNGWTFTWNGENRLIAAESSDTRLEFSYDYMGRRIEKKIYTKGLFTLYDWSLVKHHKFVYDGYKLIAEFDVLDADAQPVSYLWQPVGLDVPLMRNSEYYIVDGNKNVIELRNAAGAVTASYAYNPFGAQESPTAEDENPFRFSSEYHDDETGLVYYNYRYYSPELGRWTKRDPIEEVGGDNIYTLIGNNVINVNDKLGMVGASDARWVEEIRRTLNANSAIWYCERKIDPSGLTDDEIQSLDAKDIQHAYISIGLDPWTQDANDRKGYGFSGGPKGILPKEEKIFNPTRCKPCHQRSLDFYSTLSYGNSKGKKCCQASESEIIDCIKNYPARKAYYAPHGVTDLVTNVSDIYVCWSWAKEALQNCCLSCGDKFKTRADK